MSLDLDDALQTFFAESGELLQAMEEALLSVEHQAADAETINAIFRAAHTIKGSAGLFGLEEIVAFTHVAESVLDRVRRDEIPLEGELPETFLKVCDHLGQLIQHVAQHTPLDAAQKDQGAHLVSQLETYLTQGEIHIASKETSNVQAAPEMPQGVGSQHWHISLRFGPDLLRHGMDPVSVLRYLCTLGEIIHLEPLLARIPPLSELDPETCYLGFEIAFASTADKNTIDGAFDFIREDTDIRILPPHSRMDDYRSLIAELQGEPLKLGEILVRCGSLTETELAEVLADQSAKGQSHALLGELLIEQQRVHPPVIAAAVEQQQQLREAKANEANLIRVDASKLDQLINLVGELIIAGAGASLAARASQSPAAMEATALVSRLVEDIRDSALNLRMVQIGATFNRFRRVVRDVAKELGKEISLEIRGGETELDKTVVEKIGDPLTHIVRNAMDHGIEAAELRLGRGKPAAGQLRLNAFHDSGSIVIEVSDDGGGLKKERILKKAIERGLVSEGQMLSDKEIFNLVFEPGFSTAETISNLSGRGVGMDVVKKNITALRGTVDLESQEGLGTTVRIRLPLTLAIIDGFLVGVGQAAYVLPLDLVEECIELPAPLQHPEDQPAYLNLRGSVLPFIRLRDLFEIDCPAPARQSIVVVHYAGQRAGIVVDRLMGEFQTVIKPLGKMFSQIRGVGGSTILGNGEVALILDIPGLIAQLCHRLNDTPPATPTHSTPVI